MVIDQRNNGASVSNAGYAVDRFQTARDGSTVACTTQRSTVAPAGFTNSLLFTTTTSGTPASSEGVVLQQRVEGFNVADLMWGTANAQTVTLSFQVRSSLTGTFSGSLVNSAFNRSYPFTYTISAANTWEYKTITIPGDTAGTWLTDNGIGIRVYWDMGSGSSLRGTAGAWTGSGFLGVTGAVSVVGTNAATWQITGVQLEAGTVASPFERRDYGRELIMCQRYCFVEASEGGSYRWMTTTGYAVSTTVAYAGRSMPVSMRTGPSVTVSVGNGFIFDQPNNTQQTSSVTDTGLSSPTYARLTIGATGMTANAVGAVGSDASLVNRRIIYSAEL